MSLDPDSEMENEDEIESLNSEYSLLNYRCAGQICVTLLIRWGNNHDCGGIPWHDDDWESSNAGGHVCTVRKLW